MADTKEDLQEITTLVHDTSSKFGLKINAQKTKVMTIGKLHESINITLDIDKLEQVENFTYLGSVIKEDGKSDTEIKRRIGLASA